MQQIIHSNTYQECSFLSKSESNQAATSHCQIKGNMENKWTNQTTSQEVTPEKDILRDNWPAISITSKAWKKKQGEGLL